MTALLQARSSSEKKSCRFTEEQGSSGNSLPGISHRVKSTNMRIINQFLSEDFAAMGQRNCLWSFVEV